MLIGTDRMAASVTIPALSDSETLTAPRKEPRGTSGACEPTRALLAVFKSHVSSVASWPALVGTPR